MATRADLQHKNLAIEKFKEQIALFKQESENINLKLKDNNAFASQLQMSIHESQINYENLLNK